MTCPCSQQHNDLFPFQVYGNGTVRVPATAAKDPQDRRLSVSVVVIRNLIYRPLLFEQHAACVRESAGTELYLPGKQLLERDKTGSEEGVRSIGSTTHLCSVPRHGA